MDFASVRRSVEEAGFELLWLEAEVRGTLGRAADPTGATRPVVRANETGQRFFLFEGDTEQEHRAYGHLMEWVDGPEREALVRGRVHPHGVGPPAMTVKTFRL